MSKCYDLNKYVKEIEALKESLQKMMDFIAPTWYLTPIKDLQSDVRRALELLGHIKRG